MRTSLAVFLFAAALSAADTPMSGTWTITGDVQGYPINETCTLTQDADKITGSCKGPEKTYDTTGQVTGQKVVLKHGGEYQGDALTLTFSGTLDDKGVLKGTIDVDPMGVSGDFSAKKS